MNGLVDVPTMDVLGIDSRRRPETLSVAEFVKLAEAAADALDSTDVDLRDR